MDLREKEEEGEVREDLHRQGVGRVVEGEGWTSFYTENIILCSQRIHGSDSDSASVKFNWGNFSLSQLGTYGPYINHVCHQKNKMNKQTKTKTKIPTDPFLQMHILYYTLYKYINGTYFKIKF